jgi:hypothetical protein
MKRLALLLPLLALAAVPCLAQDPVTNAVVQIPMEAFEKDADWRSFVPAGFTVSPADAHLELGRSRMLSLYVRFVCYADDRYYYFGGVYAREPSREQVLKGHCRIDGRTGEIPNRPPFCPFSFKQGILPYISQIPTNDLLCAAVIIDEDSRTAISDERLPGLLAAFSNARMPSAEMTPDNHRFRTLELMGPNIHRLAETVPLIPYYRVFCYNLQDSDDLLVTPLRSSRLYLAVLIPGLGSILATPSPAEKTHAESAETAEPEPHAEDAEDAE